MGVSTFKGYMGMNERIRELAEQAWDATAVSPDFGHPVSFAEKFAELIVQECIDMIQPSNDRTADTNVLITKDKIKEHFGIE